MSKDKKEKKEFLTLKEVADRLRISVRSLYRYISKGKIPATKTGYWRVKAADLEAFINARSNIRRKKK